MKWLRRRLYQCPGCWDFRYIPELAEGYECACGERMTLVDLRAASLAETLTKVAASATFVKREALDVERLTDALTMLPQTDWDPCTATSVREVAESIIREYAALAETPKETRHD